MCKIVGRASTRARVCVRFDKEKAHLPPSPLCGPQTGAAAFGVALERQSDFLESRTPARPLRPAPGAAQGSAKTRPSCSAGNAISAARRLARSLGFINLEPPGLRESPDRQQLINGAARSILELIRRNCCLGGLELEERVTGVRRWRRWRRLWRSWRLWRLWRREACAESRAAPAPVSGR